MITQNKNEFIIETNNLEFGFHKKQKLLKNINLQVKRGSIYGFLGPNGAGKTTTIRLLLGLLNDKKKCTHLFGKTLAADRIEIFSRIGALIEQPSLYENISGYDNLEITRQIRKVSKEKIIEVLKIVRLTEAAHNLVKTYSLGMKQRLGIAIALLGNPELLILDEPANGLDPNGIVEVRELLKQINREFGTTIFLSSHLLAEIEKMVTHVGIIHKGEMLFQGTIQELQKLQTKELEIHIQTNDNSSSYDLLKSNYKVAETNEDLIVNVLAREQVPAIIQKLTENNISIYEVVGRGKDLEHLFLSMTESDVIN